MSKLTEPPAPASDQECGLITELAILFFYYTIFLLVTCVDFHR